MAEENEKYQFGHNILLERVKTVVECVKETVVAYVKGLPPDRWHWCKNCSQYPRYIDVKRTRRPTSDLCDECQAKEKKQQCTV
jgi:hypothetical protein